MWALAGRPTPLHRRVPALHVVASRFEPTPFRSNPKILHLGYLRSFWVSVGLRFLPVEKQLCHGVRVGKRFEGTPRRVHYLPTRTFCVSRTMPMTTTCPLRQFRQHDRLSCAYFDTPCSFSFSSTSVIVHLAIRPVFIHAAESLVTFKSFF